MAVPQVINDGVTAFGTTGRDGNEGAVTIGGVTYVVETQTITPNWTQASDKTATGNPGRTRWTKQAYTGSITLQLATQSTQYPNAGVTFTRPVPNEAGSPLTFVVLSAPYELSNSDTGIRTVTVEMQQVINSITTA